MSLHQVYYILNSRLGLTILSKLRPSCVLLPDELQLYELCFTTRPAEEVTPAQPRPAAKQSPFERNYSQISVTQMRVLMG